MVPGGVLQLDVAGQQFAAECLGQGNIGGVVRPQVVAQFPHPWVVRPNRVADDPQTGVVGEHLLPAVVGDLPASGERRGSGSVVACGHDLTIRAEADVFVFQRSLAGKDLRRHWLTLLAIQFIGALPVAEQGAVEAPCQWRSSPFALALWRAFGRGWREIKGI